MSHWTSSGLDQANGEIKTIIAPAIDFMFDAISHSTLKTDWKVPAIILMLMIIQTIVHFGGLVISRHPIMFDPVE